MSNAAKSWTLIAILALTALVSLYMIIEMKERDKALTAAYRTAHKCVRNGFAGQYAVPTYVCDTGFILETEMAELAEAEGLI